MTVTLQKLADYLERAAKAGTPVYYIDVTEYFQLPVPRNWRNHVLCKMFSTLDQEDADAKRPFRTSMVVRKRQKFPGVGFFASLAEKTGRSVTSDLNMKNLHKSEMEEVIKRFRN